MLDERPQQLPGGTVSANPGTAGPWRRADRLHRGVPGGRRDHARRGGRRPPRPRWIRPGSGRVPGARDARPKTSAGGRRRSRPPVTPRPDPDFDPRAAPTGPVRRGLPRRRQRAGWRVRPSAPRRRRRFEGAAAGVGGLLAYLADTQGSDSALTWSRPRAGPGIGIPWCWTRLPAATWNRWAAPLPHGSRRRRDPAGRAGPHRHRHGRPPACGRGWSSRWCPAARGSRPAWTRWRLWCPGPRRPASGSGRR